MSTLSRSANSVVSVSIPKWQALVALVLGLAVIAGAGLAAPSAIHNSTHDTRHAFGLPCH